MKTVTMLEFRKNAKEIVERCQRGERITMTYRGKPVVRLEPIQTEKPDTDDPFYNLAEIAAEGGETLTNREMDEIIYEEHLAEKKRTSQKRPETGR